MAPSGGSTFSILGAFRDFYVDVVRLKEAAESHSLYVTLMPSGAQSDRASDDDLAEILSARLSTTLEHQARLAEASGGAIVLERYRYAQFAMAALADEIFLHIVDWPGRATYIRQLTEKSLFGTRSAGDKLYDRIIAIENWGRDPLAAEVAEVYLLVLGLGFEGRYRGLDDADRRIQPYRDGLAAFIRRADPDYQDVDNPLFAVAYKSTLADGPGGRLPGVGRWLVAIGVAIGLYLAVSHVLWIDATSLVRTVL